MAHENATPRPWHYSHGLRRILGALDDDFCHPQVAEGISKRISDRDPRAIQFENDAALIVEAVNAYDTLRAENERLEKEVTVSEQERVAALAALRLAADRLYEEGAPQAYVDDARSVLLGFTPEGERVLQPAATPEQVAALFEELSKGPVQGGKNAQIAYAKCAKIVRSKLVRAALSEAQP